MYRLIHVFIPKGSNARQSSVSPCDLCIMRAHANCTGNCLRSFQCPIFIVDDIGFSIRSIEI